MTGTLEGSPQPSRPLMPIDSWRPARWSRDVAVGAGVTYSLRRNRAAAPHAVRARGMVSQPQPGRSGRPARHAAPVC